MPKDGRTAQKAKTQGLYDRIADVQNLAMKLNGYRASVAKYLRSLNLRVDAESMVLDAGCGTGIVSLAFQDSALSARRPAARPGGRRKPPVSFWKNGAQRRPVGVERVSVTSHSTGISRSEVGRSGASWHS